MKTTFTQGLGRRLATVLLASLLAIACSAGRSGPATAGDYWPAETWRTSKPEKQGLDSKILDRIGEYVQKDFPGTSSVLLVRNGYVVFEKYYQATKDELRATYSMTKSVISALTGIAIEKGLIESEASKVYGYLPDSIRSGMNDDARKITIQHLLTMASGFESNGGTGTMEPVLLKMYFERGLNSAPGEGFGFNGNNPNLLSIIITEKSGMRASEFAQKHLFDPIGIQQAKWDEGVQYTMGAYGLRLSTMDMAKLGYLYLRKGKWKGIQVLSEQWVAKSTRKQTPIPTEFQTPGINDAYGYLWWTMSYGEHSAFSAIGYDGQRICVIPDYDLVIVFTGASGGFDVEHLPIIRDCILKAIKS